MTYQIQFFRQWLRDVGVDDMTVEGSLDHAMTVAQVTLEELSRKRTSRFKPRTAFILDGETREVLVAYRLTDGGTVELPLGAKPSARAVPTIPRLRVVDNAAAAKS